MSIRAFAASAEHAKRLRGRACVRVGIGYGKALLLDFGTLAPPDESGYMQPQIGLVAECPWRLESSGAVIVGSGDPTESGDQRLKICLGKVVAGVAISRPSYTLRLGLTDDLTLWVFPDDSRDFAVDQKDPRSSWYVAGFAVPSAWED